MTTSLKIQKRSQEDLTTVTGSAVGQALMTTPHITPDYWTYRVQVSDTQAIVGFPKFGSLGIGFQHEGTEYNLNAVYDHTPNEVYWFIQDNKGDDSINRETCIAAIRKIQSSYRASLRRK